MRPWKGERSEEEWRRRKEVEKERESKGGEMTC